MEGDGERQKNDTERPLEPLETAAVHVLIAFEPLSTFGDEIRYCEQNDFDGPLVSAY